MANTETPDRFAARALEAGEGILRLKPTWVPRNFTTPGGRLRLDRNDLYAMGEHRGGICERWIVSTTKADNGPLTSADEGLSYVNFEGRDVLLSEVFAESGPALLGEEIWKTQGAWNVLCKMFDNVNHVPLHVHHNSVKAADVNQKDKPEAYFFPRQFNFIEHEFPLTYFGLHWHVTRHDIIKCLRKWDDEDNRVVDLSAAYRLRPDEGWQVNPGILHAPGSLASYTIEKCSDVFAMFQNKLGEAHFSWDQVVKNIPKEHQKDYDYIVDLVDFKGNSDPEFVKKSKLVPISVHNDAQAKDQGYGERWVTYGRADYSAKELTVKPGRKCIVKDSGPYGAYVIQGHGKIGKLAVEAPGLISFGAMTQDELFVSNNLAVAGVEIVNQSESEPLVILKHFGPDNPDSASLVRRN
jgi:hypothetical protein